MAFVDPHGEVWAIELKAKRGWLSEAQAAVKRHLEQTGHGYLCAQVIDDLYGDRTVLRFIDRKCGLCTAYTRIEPLHRPPTR